MGSKLQLLLLPLGFLATLLAEKTRPAANCPGFTKGSAWVQTRSQIREQQSRDDFCQGKKGLFAAPSDAEGNSDCRGYYNCFNGNEPMQLCSPGQRFNSDVSNCDWASNVDCLEEPPATVPTTSSTTVTSSTNVGMFEPVDGGADRACRGARSNDNSASYYTVMKLGAEACKDQCARTAGCKGVEYKGNRCELWTRPAGIGASIQLSGYTCLRFVPEGALTSTTMPIAATSTTAATTTAPTTTAAATLGPTSSQAGTTLPGTGVSAVDAVIDRLSAADFAGVFMYDTGNGWLESDVYTWPDMVKAVQTMASRGIGDLKLWVGDEGMTTYALVNIAAFLAQCMQETIQYNACDENNWSDKQVVAEAGGSTYSAASACGQLHQSYQDYGCTAEEDALAGGRMACEVDLNMEMRASTQAQWYGAPAKLFCAPRSKVPKAPRWDYTAPWCPPEDGWGHEAAFPEDVDLATYFEYVREGGSCKDYQGIKTGGWTFEGEGCEDGACPNSAAPLFGQPNGRTDVEGCCWWGRGVIQTTGVCNFGKLNFYMGKRAADEGRSALFPSIDLCKNPSAICDKDSPGELKWIAGFFYWMNSVQPYSSGGWSYMDELKSWVDGGMSDADKSFINGASGIVNRGCHNPPNCGTGELHAGEKRAENFRKVLKAMGLA